MTPTGEQYAIAAFCEAMANHIDNRVVWFALFQSKDGKTLDDNVQAAIHAKDWLNKFTE